MAATTPHWVLCGGATHQDAPEDALRLNIGPGDGHEIDVEIDGIEDRLTGTLPDRLRDLLCIASFVLAADCGVRRGTDKSADDGARWRRLFRFVIPVSDAEFWQQARMRRMLEQTLGFLSDDHYRFHFVAGQGAEGRQLRFLPTAGRTFAPMTSIDEVMLFSGGMDSFAGAAQACLSAGRRVLLVSHRSSDRLHGIQTRLVQDLRERAPENPPRHVSIRIRKRSEALRVENTQRTRSLLFAALAAGVAWLCGHRRIHFYENGVIALNVPIAAQVLGARGTRTVHPQAIERFGSLLSAVMDQPFAVENPFEELTRADVAGVIRDTGAADLLRYTWSCARVRHASKDGPFCGVCSQCVDRQFAVRAAGLLHEEPETLYQTRLFDDRLPNEAAVQMGLGYLQTARDFKRLTTPTSFLSRFGAVGDAVRPLAKTWGCSQDEALARLQDLHRRQGEMVYEVMGDEMKRRAEDLGESPAPDTLLGHYLGGGLERGKRAHGLDQGPFDATPSEASAAVEPPQEVDVPGLLMPGATMPSWMFVNVGDGWLVGKKGQAGFLVKDSAGMALIATLLRHPRRSFHALELEAVAEGREPPASLPGSMPTTDLAAIGQLRDRVRELVEEEEDLRGIGLDGRADVLRAEREAIEEQLAKDLKPGGGVREAPREAEQARDRVRKRIGRALGQIAKKPGGAVVKSHLGGAIRQGYSLAYQPKDAPPEWVLDR